MTHPDQPPPPDWSPPPQPPAVPRPKRWKWIVPLVAVLTVGAGVGGYLAVQAFSTFTLSGQLVISGAGGTCDDRGYQDIREGTQVEVVSQAGELLSAGSLIREWGRGMCAYTFTAPDVPTGERLYGVRLGNSKRGTIWSDEDEARRGVVLSLGD